MESWRFFLSLFCKKITGLMEKLKVLYLGLLVQLFSRPFFKKSSNNNKFTPFSHPTNILFYEIKNSFCSKIASFSFATLPLPAVFSLLNAVSIYCLLISTPINLLRSSLQATAVVPLPINGSNTILFFLVVKLIRYLHKDKGLTVLCLLKNLFHFLWVYPPKKPYPSCG